MMYSRWLIGCFATLGLLVFAVAAAHGEGGHEISVLVGAGLETTTAQAFFPEMLTVHVGDTVSWKIQSDDGHTVTFLGGGDMVELIVPVPDAEPGTLMFNPAAAFATRMPGGPVETITGTTFANSGVMAIEPEVPDTPPNDTFTATFNEPGLYEYVCLFHPWMKGAVMVLPDAAAEVPEQPEIDQQAQAEMDELLGLIDLARVQSETAFSEPGPDGTTIWYLKAGAVNGVTADLRAQAYEFLPEELTIREGDTVVWTSAEIHTITFVPLPPTPEALVIEPQENGPPLLLLNPEVFFPVKPAGVYDPLQYFNSGPIGPVGIAGLSFSLTFRDAGSYEYVCALHEALGMKGIITVLPR